MTRTDGSSTEPPHADLTKSVRDEALQIASWCEIRRAESETRANAQIRVVWFLLLGGLVLLLVLPRLLQEIDYAWQKDSLPPEVIERAEITARSIADNRAEMEIEAGVAERRLAAAEQALKTARDQERAMADAFSAMLTPPLSTWENAAPREIGLNYTIQQLRVLEDRRIVALLQDFSVSITPALLTMGPDSVELAYPETGQSEWLGVMPTRSGQLIAAVSGNRDSDSIVRLPSGDRLWPGPDAGTPPVTLVSLARDGDTAFLALGFSGADADHGDTGDARQILLVSANGQDWAPPREGAYFPLGPGLLTRAAPLPRGGLAIAGSKGWVSSTGGLTEAARATVWIRTGDSGTWRESRIMANGGPVAGAALYIAANRRGDLIVVTATTAGRQQVYISGDDGRSWQPAGPGVEITALGNDAEGGFLAAGKSTTRAGTSQLILRSADGKNWDTTVLETNGREVSIPVDAIAVVNETTAYLGGDGLLMRSVDGHAAELIGETALARGQLPPEVLVPEGAAAQLAAVAAKRREIEGLQGDIEQQAGFADAARASFSRQDTAHSEFGALSQELETALRTAEPARQMAQIATRLAVIGLLIYLVQIVVNRYRYLQRLAGFYQARAQALRLLAASPDASLLRGVSLSDVTTMLSPDAIGFDKSAEPPTGQMVSLLQAGLRKG